MSASLDRLTRNKRLMAYTAAAMFGGASLDGAIEGLIPGDPPFALAPLLAAIVIVVTLVSVGPRRPRRGRRMLGPIGVLLIAAALSATPAAGDGAVLYMWPVLWSTFFFGRRGAISIVAWIGVAHLITLLQVPAVSSFPGRWVDVMVSVSVVAAVVLTLVRRNDQLLEELREEARTDALTGLLNRRGFEERAALELKRARRDSAPLAAVTFDIDYFKRVNDEWGHEVGDRVLARTGELLADQSRDIDVVARFGGEEFVVLLPGCDGAAAEAFADRAREALARDRVTALPNVRLSAGILAASVPVSIEALLQGADAAMYRAKRSGRDRTVLFEQQGGRAAGLRGGRGVAAAPR